MALRLQKADVEFLAHLPRLVCDENVALVQQPDKLGFRVHLAIWLFDEVVSGMVGLLEDLVHADAVTARTGARSSNGLDLRVIDAAYHCALNDGRPGGVWRSKPYAVFAHGCFDVMSQVVGTAEAAYEEEVFRFPACHVLDLFHVFSDQADDLQ